MADKVQKIREEVQKIARSINPYIPDEEGKNSEYYSKVGGDSHDEALENAIWYCVNNLI